MVSHSRTPDRTLEQKRAALVEANRVRTARAKVKRDIKAGKRSIIPLIEDPPEDIKNMKVFELLRAVPKVAKIKSYKILQQCQISSAKTVGGLSERQRTEILYRLMQGGLCRDTK